MTMIARWALALAFVAVVAKAEIRFDATARAIRVRDFPASSPARLEKILQADRMNGWNVVSFDPAKNVYAIDADLFVGQDRSTETVLKIGDAGPVGETLVLNGDLVVFPTAFIGDKATTPGEPNRLIVGDVKNPSVRGFLALNGHDLYVGARPIRGLAEMKNGVGGECHVYGGRLFSNNNVAATWFHGGYRGALTLDNAELDGVGLSVGTVTATIAVRNAVLKNSSGLRSFADFEAENCVFEGLRTAIQGVNCRVLLKTCLLKRNQRNFAFPTGGGIVTEDCDIVAAETPDALSPSTVAKRLRHVVVRVNGEGHPIANALVEIAASGATNTALRTDTPGQYAFLLAENGASPDTARGDAANYAVSVSASGYVPVKNRPFKIEKSPAMVDIVLEKY